MTISRIDFEKSICRPFQLRKLKLNSEYKLTLGHIGLDGSFNFVDQCSTRNLASTCGTTTNANTTDIEPKIDTSTNLLFNENTTNIAQTSSSSTAKNSAGSKKLEEKLSEISNMSPSEMKVSSTSEQDSVVNIKNSKGKTAKNSNSTQKSEKNNASKNSKQGNSDKNVSKKINNATSTSRHNHPGGHGPNDSSSQGEGQNQNQLSAITASSSIDSGKPSSSKFTNSSATIDDMTVSPHSIGLLQTVDQDQLQNQHQQAVDLQKLKNIGDTITNLKLSGLHFSGVKFQWQFLRVDAEPRILLTMGFFLEGGSPEILGNPPKIMGNPSKIMGNPSKIMGNPSKIMGNPSNIMGTPPKSWGTPQKSWGTPPKSWGTPPTS